MDQRAHGHQHQRQGGARNRNKEPVSEWKYILACDHRLLNAHHGRLLVQLKAKRVVPRKQDYLALHRCMHWTHRREVHRDWVETWVRRDHRETCKEGDRPRDFERSVFKLI
jgi:hypothetical protein